MSSFISRYLRSGTQPSIEGIRSELWASGSEEPALSAAAQQVVLEQYRIYTEMADRISARRGLANTFFLTINTAVAAFVAEQWKGRPAAVGFALFLLAVMLVQCMAWYWILRSYRQLNAAKYLVIGVMEERLPASPYWRAEWQALGRGTDPALYWPLTHLEQWVPVLFAVIYIVAFVALAVS